MIIGIDGNEANIKNRVGVNVYAFELLWALSENFKIKSGKHKLIVYFKSKPLEDLPTESGNLKYIVIPGKGIWVLTKLMPYLFSNPQKIDLFYTPNHYLPLFSPVPMIMSVMDLGYLKFSEQFKVKDYWQLKLWTAYSLRVSKYIISISEATKNDIVRHYSFAKNKTFVTQLAYGKDRFNQKVDIEDVRRIKNKYSIVNDYVLFLSTLKPSKNVEGLLDAWKLISQKFDKLNLVVAGKKGWLYESIFEKVKKESIKGVVFTDFIPETDKPALVAGAKVFCLPSFWEGFGLDVLNALACGVPVVVSDRGSLPEVVGNVGTIVNPQDYNSIAKGIEKILTLPKSEYNSLVNKGINWAKRFSWDKTARETLEVFEKLK